MLFWLVCGAAVLVLAVLIIALLRPTANTQGGSLELFISDQEVQPPPGPQNQNEDERYREVFTKAGKQVLILYMTEYGFSEFVAKRLFDALRPLPDIQPRMVNARDKTIFDFMKEQLVLVVCSTAGDGAPPSEAAEFFNEFMGYTLESFNLSHLRFSVLALGDSSYQHYCRTGKRMEKKLKALGAECVYPRVNVDMEDWSSIQPWLDAIVEKVSHQIELEVRDDYILSRSGGKSEKHSRTRPYRAEMTVKYTLTNFTGEDSDKEVIHVELRLGTDSELTYTAGDAVGIYPTNNPSEVSALLSTLPPTERDLKVAVPSSAYEPKPDGLISLRAALTNYYDLKNVKPELIAHIAQAATDPADRDKAKELLLESTSLTRNRRLRDYLYGREVADVLAAFSSFKPEVEELLKQMKPLQPRYYSISSSPVVDGQCVGVTAAVLRYTTLGKARTGVATTFLADRVEVGESCPIFISRNPEFRLPDDNSKPIIMVGPGTGIAPFRAFMQERVAKKATGQNLLYFGCRHQEKDFLYRKELEDWAQAGLLSLRTAFSRDQKEKVYVQHRLIEDAEIIWKLLEEGRAHVYVCGDGKAMAEDVQNALLRIFKEQGEKDEAGALLYLQVLEKTKRYQRDVWIT
jgi:sulfite reductase (NADPH) flavoprotein alpha-component